MLNQYYAQRSRQRHEPIRKTVHGVTILELDPRDHRRVGTIAIGTIVYIQDGVSPLAGFRQPVVCREPWQVQAWLPREYTKYDPVTRQHKSVRVAGGHLALVRSLRNSKRVELVADWILLHCIDAGLDEPKVPRRLMSKAKIIQQLTAPGAVVTMVRHDWSPSGRLIGIPRKVLRVQRTKVQFEGGSWLDFPSAKCWRETNEGFEICLFRDGSFKSVMGYRVVGPQQF